MPDLEMLLRDVRPVPTPDFTARLDKKVAAGFPGPEPGWKKKLRALREHFAALSLATATIGAMFLVVIVIAKNVDGGGGDDAAGGSSVAMSTESKSSSGASATEAPPLATRESAPDATSDSAGIAPIAPQSAKRAVIASA